MKDLLHRKRKSSSPRDARIKLTFAQKVDLHDAVTSGSFYNVQSVLEDILHGHMDQDHDLKLNLDYTVNDSFCARSPLQKAACYENSEIVKLLLEAGASPNYTGSSDGNTPLHLALQYFRKDSAIISQLVSAGANIMAQNEFGQTCLMYACRMCDMEVIKMLLSSSPDTKKLLAVQDENGFNAFHFLGENHLVDHEMVVTVMCQQPFFDRSTLNVGTPSSTLEEKKDSHSDVAPHLPLASPLERAILQGQAKLAIAFLKQGAIPYSRACIIFSGASSSAPTAQGQARQDFFCACTELYEQCREEIVTLGMHVYNPRLAHRHGPLKDVFPLILPYMWYMTRLPSLISQHTNI